MRGFCGRGREEAPVSTPRSERKECEEPTPFDDSGFGSAGGGKVHRRSWPGAGSAGQFRKSPVVTMKATRGRSKQQRVSARHCGSGTVRLNATGWCDGRRRLGAVRSKSGVEANAPGCCGRTRVRRKTHGPRIPGGGPCETQFAVGTAAVRLRFTTTQTTSFFVVIRQEKNRRVVRELSWPGRKFAELRRAPKKKQAGLRAFRKIGSRYRSNPRSGRRACDRETSDRPAPTFFVVAARAARGQREFAGNAGRGWRGRVLWVFHDGVIKTTSFSWDLCGQALPAGLPGPTLYGWELPGREGQS